ncbi:inositol monophosphatase [bacterium]|nr:inositol monophosphatase [candidate division CSSED10-310 bacterium]
MLDTYLRVAQDTAREAGTILLQGFGTRFEIHHKGEIDLVTEYDKKSEDLIIDRIHHRFPEHLIIAEEDYDRRATNTADHELPLRWYIDPLDGTTNYAHGFPFFCVSIALWEGGEALVGVVFDPIRDELFHAVRGRGAYLAGKRLAVSGERRLEASLLATGFPYDIRTSDVNNLDYFSAMIRASQGVRRPGAAALDICYVAAGRLDGFWELKLKPWDTAAGVLMVEEAGGMVTDLHLQPFEPIVPHLIASNGHIHEAMYHVLRGVGIQC